MFINCRFQKKKKKKLVRLYHYTNKDGIKGIASSGEIAASTDTKNDAAYGPGTYATKHGPENSKSQIAKNNYDGLWTQQESSGKVDHCVEFKVSVSKVEQAPVKDRDVWVHKGPVKLHEAEDVKFHVRQDDGKIKTYVPKDKSKLKK